MAPPGRAPLFEKRVLTMSNTGFFATLTQAMKTWNARRETRAMLESMGDRELKDIGLTRSDINAVAEGRYEDRRHTLWNERAELRAEWAVLESARRTIESKSIAHNEDHRMAA